MLIKKFKVSERRACVVVGQHRSTNRYSPVPSDFEDKLVARMIELADEHPKWGYRMIWPWPDHQHLTHELDQRTGAEQACLRLLMTGRTRASPQHHDHRWIRGDCCTDR